MENSLSKEMGENTLKLSGLAYENTKKVIKAIVNPESVKKDSGDKKEDKKEKSK